MKYGLTEQNITKITNLFANNSNVEEAILFGSRAKGNYKEGSDIDVCLKGENLSLQDIISLQIAYDDTYLLYKLDLVIYNKITEPNLINHIDRIGVRLYQNSVKMNDNSFQNKNVA